MADSYAFLDAKEQLENEMTDRQRRLIKILTGQYRCESSAAEKELLENEIEDRKNALEKLEAQPYCDSCEKQVDVDEKFRIRMTKYSEKLLHIKLMMEKVRVRVECADCRRKKDEIDQEIETLWASTQRQKLEKFAAYRVQGLGRAGCGRTAEDLLQEALVSTLIGAENAGEGKHFNKSRVDFVRYLGGAIRNISFCWKQKFKEWEPSLESDIITRNTEGDEISPLENVASSDPSADQCLSAKEEVERIFKKFGNDKEAIAVLQARLEGVTTAREIMQGRNLTKRQYEAARRRIRCQKSALVIEQDEQVLGLLVRWLKAKDFAVPTASTADEGLRLYGECGPFDVVILSYSPRLNGVQIATDIRKKNPSQRMVITTTYSSEEDVVRPSELIRIPILLKPFGRDQLCTVLGSSANTVREKPANCFRPRRQRETIVRMRLPLPPASASRHPQGRETLNATPSS